MNKIKLNIELYQRMMKPSIIYSISPWFIAFARAARLKPEHIKIVNNRDKVEEARNKMASVNDSNVKYGLVGNLEDLKIGKGFGGKEFSEMI